MSWWGKLIGGYLGLVLGGPIGALLGAALGHHFDKEDSVSEPAARQDRLQTAFYAATFSVMGHICKADGRVTPDEISTAKMIMARMALTTEQVEMAIKLFDQGKDQGFPLQAVLLQLKNELALSKDMKRMFLEIQCYAAYADGVIHPNEKAILMKICDIIGLPQYEFESIAVAIEAETKRHGSSQSQPEQMSLPDAYSTLGLASNAQKDEVKRIYRRLISQHHPDKLVSKGLPEEMIKIANQRTQEIREAYEIIMKAK